MPGRLKSSVNGCQTSNVLFELREEATSEVTLMVKVVETTNSAIVDDIVRATNKQTQVDEHQVLASLDTVKAIERYLRARAEDEEHRLYFERRTNQFSNQDPPKMRVFDIKELARCVGSMLFDLPHLATRYPNHLTTELKNSVFNIYNKEEIFYTAAFVLYRLQCHFGNRRVSPLYRKYRLPLRNIK